MSLNWAINHFLLRFDGCDLDVTFELLDIFFVVVICNARTVQYVDIQILLLISYGSYHHMLLYLNYLSFQKDC